MGTERETDAYVIGLTGNIAAGKSTVARMLARLGAHVIDADDLAHWIMRKGTEVNRQIARQFGETVLTPDGEVDRTILGALVFSDPSKLRDLESIVHPAVIEETLLRLEGCKVQVCAVEAIKLLESGMGSRCSAIWVVVAPRSKQLARLMLHRGLTSDDAALRIDAQTPACYKLRHADLVIDNSCDLEATWGQVVAGWDAIPGAHRAPCGMSWDDVMAGAAT